MLQIRFTWNVITCLRIYAIALIIFSIFRFILFLNEFNLVDDSVIMSDILFSFFMGVRFDFVISSYILFIPYIILTIYYYFFRVQALKFICFYFLFIIFSLSFIVAAADIPYFSQFFSRFSATAFDWIDSPGFVFQMIIEEPRYWFYFIPLIISIILFYILLKRILISYYEETKSSKNWLMTFVSILFIPVIFLGMRGRLDEKSPIRIGTAYFCNNPFLNQLGLNPNFTLIRSIIEKNRESNKPIELMDNAKAISNVQKYLKIDEIDSHYPILRKEKNVDTSNDVKNIIVVIMESMSCAKMGIHGNNDNLTPFLDSISKLGYYFENTYSAGIHTFNGIFSTIFSYPAVFKQNPMKESSIFKYHGIASTTKKLGYSTLYFTTHDGQFDNVESFLKANDFERVISKKDYPSEKVKTTLGVPDDYMFEFSIPVLNDLYNKGKPFLSVFMTASDHGPYYVPEYFKPLNIEIKKQIVEYADYSLKKFIQLSEKEPWFKNTLFVFIADHGAPLTAIYDLSLDYNHVPLLFFQPSIIKEGKRFAKMAGQIDVFPSTIGLLNIPFENNTLGINLFKEDRPYIYFNADDKYGVIDQNWLLIVNRDNSLGLYKYKDNDLTHYENLNPDIVKQMKEYAESHLQVTQYLIRSQKI